VCLIAFSGGLVTDHAFFPAATALWSTQTSGSPAPQVLSCPSCAAGTPLRVRCKGYDLYQQGSVQIVQQNYVGRSSVTDQQLLYGAINGMVDSLGDTGHVGPFWTPDEYAAWQGLAERQRGRHPASRCGAT